MFWVFFTPHVPTETSWTAQETSPLAMVLLAHNGYFPPGLGKAYLYDFQD